MGTRNNVTSTVPAAAAKNLIIASHFLSLSVLFSIALAEIYASVKMNISIPPPNAKQTACCQEILGNKAESSASMTVRSPIANAFNMSLLNIDVSPIFLCSSLNFPPEEDELELLADAMLGITEQPQFGYEKLLKEIRAKKAIYYIPGNWEDWEPITDLPNILKRNNIIDLTNISIKLDEKLWLAGFADAPTGNPDLSILKNISLGM